MPRLREDEENAISRQIAGGRAGGLLKAAYAENEALEAERDKLIDILVSEALCPNYHGLGDEMAGCTDTEHFQCRECWLAALRKGVEKK